MSESLLEAGAILPGAPQDAALDPMTARAYRHPVLADRTVVRLVGAAVGPAEDLTMEFLGFAPEGEPVPVGHTRRQALGFPAWALVHDPANGRHALALVKEMEKLARVAKSKPGNAKEGYDALAARLGAAAPQFLPTFWEQAGRAFIAADNQRTAGSCFTEARRAEQVHGLTVDEDRVRDVHLEFAFAGALTATMLGEYARGVVDRRPAPEAYELVKTLSLRRVAGGLPPHAAMAADLAKLAKAAGLDAEQQADEVVERLLAFPAMGRAHPTVWKAYAKSLVRLGKRDAAIRARLLEIVPEPPGYGTDMTEQWLQLLETAGATADLIAPGDASASRATRWLDRFLAGRRSSRAAGRRNARLLSLVERMAPRLIAEGGLEIAPGPWSVELDLLDLCLAAGVPVTVGDARGAAGFDVASWVGDDGAGRRELTAVAADEALRPLLAQGVRGAIARLRDGANLTSPALPARALEEAFGAAGVREVLVELLAEQTSGAGDGTVASLDADLSELAALWSAAGMALAPDGFRRLLAVDVPAVLARTLRAGLPAELCWPAFEEAAKEKLNTAIGDAWPELVVHDNQAAHVVAPDGRLTEHVFRYPPAGHALARHSYSQTGCLHVDGDLLVRWQSQNGPAGYWSSRPAELIEGELHAGHVGWGVTAIPLPIPGGGLTTGARPVHPGDHRGAGAAYPVASDGHAFWRCEWDRTDTDGWFWRWREFDPRTGDGGRHSLPAFFEAGTAQGEKLVAEACSVRPAPADWAASPLGWRDGLVGWRVTRGRGGVLIGEGVDGRRVTWRRRGLFRFGQPDRSETLAGALLLPGASAPLPVTSVPGHPHGRIRLWTADGEHLLAEQGALTSMLPPLAWWHALRPRDEAGSVALRALDDATAAAILAVDDDVTGTEAVKEAVAANLTAHLPAVTDEALRSRIVEVAARSVRLRRRIAEIPRHLDAQPHPVADLPAVNDEALRLAWDGLCDQYRSYYYAGSPGARHQVLAQVAAVGAVLGGQPVPDDTVAVLDSASAGWTVLLGGLGAVALRAAAPVTSEVDRSALAAFLTAVAGSPLAGAETSLRVLDATQQTMSATGAEVVRDGAQISILFRAEQHYTAQGPKWTRSVVQVEPTGAFSLPAGVTLRAESRPSGRLGGEGLRAYNLMLAERGPAPWRPEAVDELTERTGMTRGEAALLLAGLPGITAWEANFLSADQRKILGLSAAHAKVARAGLQELTPRERVALLDAAMPTDPAALWETGPDVDAVAQTWIRLRGRRVTVPEDLVAELARIVHGPQAASILQAIAAPTAGDWLSTDGHSKVGGYYDVQTTADRGVPFEGSHLTAVAVALPWLAYRLPWGDPLRSALPRALELVRARLRNPDLLVGQGITEVGQRPDVGPALVEGRGSSVYTIYHLAPGKLTGDDDPALGFIDEATASALRIVHSRWIDTLVSTPDAATGDPRDPQIGAPGIVAEVAERHGLGEDAAAYYLQLLALPDPTDKAVQAWNGWKPAQLRKAQEALVAAGLVVAAKRERAGRPVFLPGGWQPAKPPRLPVEAWKEPLYVDAGQVLLVPVPVPELFATAWARVADGDVPRYRDLKETK